MVWKLRKSSVSELSWARIDFNPVALDPLNVERQRAPSTPVEE